MDKRFFLKIILGVILFTNAVIFLLSFNIVSVIILLVVTLITIKLMNKPSKKGLLAISTYYIFLVFMLVYGLYKSYNLSKSKIPIVTLSGKPVSFLNFVNVTHMIFVVILIISLIYITYFIKTEKI